MPIQGASRRWHQALILRPVSRDHIQRCARSAALRRLNPPLSKGTRCRTEVLQLIAGKQRNAKWPAPLQGTSRVPAPLQAEQIFYLRCQGEQADQARPDPQTGSSSSETILRSRHHPETMPIADMSKAMARRPIEMVGRGGLEPPTSRLSGVRSNHLSYRPIPARPFKRPAIKRKARPVSQQLVEPDGIEPTTSCLQSTRSPN